MKDQFGLVLCGGGAKGAYQMGALQALEEEGYLNQIYGVSGASIGALNELFLCCCGAKVGVEVWSEINPSTVFVVDSTILDGKEGVFSRQGMRDLLYKHMDFDAIRKTTFPIYVSATLVGEKELKIKYFKVNDKNDEDIIKLMEATSALPVIYEDVYYEGEYYRDGGILDNMPIQPLYDEGCRKFFVLALSNDAKIDASLYPDAEFYLLKPYRDLGGLFSGTLNFTTQDLKTNLQLGYKDAKRFIKAYLEEDYLIATNYDLYAKMDYDTIMVERKQQELQNSIDEKLNYMSDIMKKYDV